MCLSEVLLILGCVFWLQILPLPISQINILRALGQGGRGSTCPLLTTYCPDAFSRHEQEKTKVRPKKEESGKTET